MMRVCAFLAVLLAAGSLAAQPPAAQVDQARLFRSLDHFIVNEARVRFELTADPQPLVDWALVHPGFVEYVAKATGEVLPLGEPHPYENPGDIVAMPFAAASGVRLLVEPPAAAGRFADLLGQTYDWERGEIDVNTLLYDDELKTYRVWYKVAGGTAYAESRDLRTWNKPLRKLRSLADHAETNLIGVTNLDEAQAGVLRSAAEARPGASGAFFVDPSAPASERFKTTFLAHTKTPHYDDRQQLVDRPISAMTGPGSSVLFGAVSSDGMAWRVLPEPLCYHDADTQTVTRYDPQLQKYVVYTRLYELSRRTIGYLETGDFTRWPLPVNILAPGPGDRPSVDFYSNAFSYYPGQPGLRLIFCTAYDRTRDNAEIRLATSRDGRSFHFSPGPPIVSPGDADEPGHGMLIPKPGLVRRPDGRLLLVYGAWRMPHKFPRHHQDKIEQRYADLCAEWPADRMVALVADDAGEFSSVPFVLRGSSLAVNLLTEPTGGVQVEVRDERYRPIAGRTFADADTLSGDRASTTVTWNGTSDLSAHRGGTIWLRFRLKQAKLYAIAAGE